MTLMSKMESLLSDGTDLAKTLGKGDHNET